MESAQIPGSKKTPRQMEILKKQSNRQTVHCLSAEDTGVQYLEYCVESWPVQFKGRGDRGDVEKDN